MNQFFKSLIIFCGAFVLLISCSDNSTNNPVEKQIVPTALGNVWVYRDSIFDLSGTIVDTISGKITATRQVTIGGINYSLFTQSEYDVPDSAAILINIDNESDGLYVYGGNTDSSQLLYRNLLLKYPVTAGDQWQCVYHYYKHENGCFHHDTSQVTCIGTSVEYITPAGSFSCIEYMYQVSPTIQVIEYYVPNIGLIAALTKLSDTVYSKREILSYTLY
jgi:hypothetical protein